MPHAQMRPVNWLGQPTPEALEAQEWYAEQLREAGVLVDDACAWYVEAAPDEERRGEP